MRIGIDASNLRAGGGVTHLAELLCAARPLQHGFDRIIVWAPTATLSALGQRPWVRKAHDPLLDLPFPGRLYWQRFRLEEAARSAGCDVVFTPGGSYSGKFRPFVTMSQNMLPFETSEVWRYGVSFHSLKFLLLRCFQLETFRRSDGLIFLTEYARRVITKRLTGTTSKFVTIPHGVSDRFRHESRTQKPASHYSHASPYRLLYVSPIAPYKHQAEVLEATWQLRRAGSPLVLDLVGPTFHRSKRFFNALHRLDPQQQWACYRGVVPFDTIHTVYHQADAFVFASSCENLPNTLLEAMAAGLPIASSNTGPMTEVLGDAAVYFDPERPAEIAAAIRRMLEDRMLREQKAGEAYDRASGFNWQRCARETFEFIRCVIRA